jgi:hypothetical protein
MSDPSDLKPFKISDQVKQPVDRPRPGQKQPEAPEPSSAGFPRIEALVEADAPDVSGLEARQAALEEMAQGTGSNKEKAAAKKAALAYAKVRALIDYLLETKRKMSDGPGGDASGG